ncbi:MAG: hypothetical protein JXR50_01180 [Prolixibacteraceae bacterium]|nr:hypothetical protein [Prolixibacteraceae bacterium]MBN2648333.1 hypothetical protein [Prolixibacteraceae bacterium]
MLKRFVLKIPRIHELKFVFGVILKAEFINKNICAFVADNNPMPLDMIPYYSLPISGTRFGFNHREKTATNRPEFHRHGAYNNFHHEHPFKFETVIFTVPTELTPSNTFHHRVETRRYNIIPFLSELQIGMPLGMIPYCSLWFQPLENAESKCVGMP